MAHQPCPDSPAFPQPASGEKGLSIRQYFAASALQGILGATNLVQADADHLAKKAVDFADALMRELLRRKDH
jgi:hypothetical protein